LGGSFPQKVPDETLVSACMRVHGMLVTSDVEVGADATDCCVMDQHLPTDHRH